MRRVKPEGAESKADLTPVIDIVFNLLIFFLCATKIRAAEGVIRAHLPKDVGLSGGATTAPLNDVRIRLLWHDAAGRRVRGEGGHVVVAVGERVLNAPGDLDAPTPNHPVWRDLHARLVELQGAAQGGPFTVIIDARPEVPTQAVVFALNEVVRAEVPEVRFAAPETPF